MKPVFNLFRQGSVSLFGVVGAPNHYFFSSSRANAISQV